MSSVHGLPSPQSPGEQRGKFEGRTSPGLVRVVLVWVQVASLWS
ncbi:hypothetical protein N9166_01595 [bacterium]|nr:hypothetical protein [bacterium]